MVDKLKTTDYMFLAGTLFAAIVFVTTIYGIKHGYIESNPLMAGKTHYMMILLYGGAWSGLLMLHVFLREKPWINSNIVRSLCTIPAIGFAVDRLDYLSYSYSSLICGIPFFNMLNDVTVVFL